MKLLEGAKESRYGRDFMCDWCGRYMITPKTTIDRQPRNLHMCDNCFPNPLGNAVTYRLHGMREGCISAHYYMTGQKLYPERSDLLTEFAQVLSQTELLLGRVTWLYEQYDMLQTFIAEKGSE